MKMLKLSTLTAGVLLASLANADSALAGPGGPHGTIDLLLGSPFSATTDTNGDGRISPEEMRTAMLAEFNAIRGEDYFVSLAEMTAGQQNKLVARFTALNTDGAEGLTVAELTAGETGEEAVVATNLFKIGDANGDSLLSLGEFKALAGAIISPILPFVTLDTDGDGKLSEAEFIAPPHHGAGKGKGPH